VLPTAGEIGQDFYKSNMFKWLNKQGVESTEGFSLRRVDRFHYQYIEGDRVINIAVEPGIEWEEISFPSPLSWDGASDSERASEEDQKVRIRSNVSEALVFMGIKHRI
jgi:hypothetical protein